MVRTELLLQRRRGDVVEAQIQHGVHHPGHADGGAGTDGEEEGVGGIAEGPAHVLLHHAELGDGLLPHALGQEAAVLVEGVADFGGEGEAWGVKWVGSKWMRGLDSEGDEIVRASVGLRISVELEKHAPKRQRDRVDTPKAISRRDETDWTNRTKPYLVARPGRWHSFRPSWRPFHPVRT